MSEAQQENLQPSLESLAAELARLRERVEDLEDARDLDTAIERNSGAPLVPWHEVKTELGLEEARTPGIQRTSDGVTLNAVELRADDVAHQRVLCPGCGAMVFEMWPEGWDGHAAYKCSAVSGNEEERKSQYKKRFRHLFR
jgi:hypothetical protein